MVKGNEAIFTLQLVKRKCVCAVLTWG